MKMTKCTYCGKEIQEEQVCDFYEMMDIQICSEECGEKMREWLRAVIHEICCWKFKKDIREAMKEDLPAREVPDEL